MRGAGGPAGSVTNRVFNALQRRADDIDSSLDVVAHFIAFSC